MQELEFSDRLGNMRIQAFAIGLALAGAAIGGARATEVQFTISDGGQTTTFELDPTSGIGALGFVFFPSVPVTVGGSPATPLSASVTFFSEGEGGGFVMDGLVTDGFVFTKAPQFYLGSESSPTFPFGGYAGLLNGITGNFDTVTVEPPDPPGVLAVPELSTWAMLLLGFVGLSCAGYRKARNRRTFPA
jgi:hypothetical protein